MMGALLLAAYREDGEVVQLLWQGDGPLGKVIVQATSSGESKGMVSNSACDLPLRPDGKLDVGGAVGKYGTLTCTRSLPKQKEPFRGVVPLASGEIAEDLAAYLQQSEQIGAAVALGVLVAPDLSVEQAGGFFIQVLPFASEETLSTLEANLAGLPSMTTLMSAGHSPAAVTEMLLGKLGVSPGAELCAAPKYGPCVEDDIRARMERACVSLGLKELRDILASEEKLECVSRHAFVLCAHSRSGCATTCAAAR